MKVVLFCGGFGTRMWDHERNVPKPMVEIGYRPLLWHVMRYYAHFGHKDFILCLGYKANVIKDYFLKYTEATSNDFVLTNGNQVELLSQDINDWRITFVDTGLDNPVGERLRLVSNHLAGEERFLVNYSDGVTDLDLNDVIDLHERSGSVLSALLAKPTSSFHVVRTEGAEITGVEHIVDSETWINAGYFVADQRIFDYLNPGEDLVPDAFPKLIADGELSGHKYDGFWTAMDTFKDRQRLEKLHAEGSPPWQVWAKKPVTA